MTDPTTSEREVSAWLEFIISSPAVLALQIAVSPKAGPVSNELLAVTLDGADTSDSVSELPLVRGDRVHLVSAQPGRLRIHYAAEVGASAPVTRRPDPVPTFDSDTISALRQSRYCPSDTLAGFAYAEFAEHRDRPDLGRMVASWVFERLTYDARYTNHLDSAVETLVKNEGVCRDFAHVTIALCRALGLPAKLVAVYAPGLSPMDFHAVVEVWSEGGWEVIDPTRLAPRSSLVRIASGRDAADTAFATTLQGDVELSSIEVGAIVQGHLPTMTMRSASTSPSAGSERWSAAPNPRGLHQIRHRAE